MKLLWTFQIKALNYELQRELWSEVLSCKPQHVRFDMIFDLIMHQTLACCGCMEELHFKVYVDYVHTGSKSFLAKPVMPLDYQSTRNSNHIGRSITGLAIVWIIIGRQMALLV